MIQYSKCVMHLGIMNAGLISGIFVGSLLIFSNKLFPSIRLSVRSSCSAIKYLNLRFCLGSCYNCQTEHKAMQYFILYIYAPYHFQAAATAEVTHIHNSSKDFHVSDFFSILILH